MASRARKKDGSGIGPLIRSDGRMPDECREVKAHLNYIQTAPGSCLFEMGNTRVLCTATTEDQVPPDGNAATIHHTSHTVNSSYVRVFMNAWGNLLE